VFISILNYGLDKTNLLYSNFGLPSHIVDLCNFLEDLYEKEVICFFFDINLMILNQFSIHNFILFIKIKLILSIKNS